MLYLLLLALRARLQAVLEELNLPEPGKVEKMRSPRVFIGDLPPKKGDLDEEYPFVLLRAVGGADGGEGEEATSSAMVEIICGVWNQERREDRLCAEGGENDLLNLVAWCRRALLCQRLLEGRFDLTEDEQGRLLVWEKPEDQPKPYWQAVIRTRWNMPGYAREFGAREEDI